MSRSLPLGAGPRAFRAIPTLGAMALLLCGQGAVAQTVPAPAPTWQSSPTLTKFMTELRLPGQIPVAVSDGTRAYKVGKTTTTATHYTIDINEFTDSLHPALPPTTLWGYNPTLALGVGAGAIVPQKHLGGIIIANKGVPTQISFRNNLPDKHILPVDTSIQGSDPTVTQNRTSTHLHGGLVPWFSDGGPFAFWDRTGNKGVSNIGNAVLNPPPPPMWRTTTTPTTRAPGCCGTTTTPWASPA